MKPIWLKLLGAVAVGMALQAPMAALGQDAPPSQLAPDQILHPSEFSSTELASYRALTDTTAASNFIATRSYVRVCRQVADEKLSGMRLPSKPPGFRSRYLYPGDEELIDKCVTASIAAMAAALWAPK
jgi:hypothetical protein